MCFCGDKFLPPSGKYLEMTFLNYMVRVCSILLGNTKLSSKVAAAFCISLSNEWEFLLLHFLAGVCCC